MKQNRLIAYLIVVVLSFSAGGILDGCKGERGPAGTPLTGDLTGSVVLSDSLNNPISNRSGVAVSLSPDVGSATSLPDGSWQVGNVPAGIYDITFTKPGFFTSKMFQFQFVGGGNYAFYPTRLYQFMHLSVSDLSATDSAAFIRFQGTLHYTVAYHLTVYILLSLSPFPKSVPVTGFSSVTVPVSSGTEFSYKVGSTYFGVAAVPGDTLYAIAILTNNLAGINYTATGDQEFDTEGFPLSNPVSFVVPTDH